MCVGVRGTQRVLALLRVYAAGSIRRRRRRRRQRDVTSRDDGGACSPPHTHTRAHAHLPPVTADAAYPSIGFPREKRRARDSSYTPESDDRSRTVAVTGFAARRGVAARRRHGRTLARPTRRRRGTMFVYRRQNEKKKKIINTRIENPGSRSPRTAAVSANREGHETNRSF